MSHIKIVEKIKIHILCSITFFLFLSKIVPFIRYVRKYRTAGQATNDNTAHAHSVLDKATRNHEEHVALIAFPVPLWSNEHSSILRYTHIICIVCSAVGQEMQAGGEAVTVVGRH